MGGRGSADTKIHTLKMSMPNNIDMPQNLKANIFPSKNSKISILDQSLGFTRCLQMARLPSRPRKVQGTSYILKIPLESLTKVQGYPKKLYTFLLYVHLGRLLLVTDV